MSRIILIYHMYDAVCLPVRSPYFFQMQLRWNDEENYIQLV
jgi:hypothetical protein